VASRSTTPPTGSAAAPTRRTGRGSTTSTTARTTATARTAWSSAPPILDNPSETRKLGGRKLDLFFDGSRLRLVAFRTPRAVYWVSNTLSLALTNKQMLDIARSLRRVGS
jgi:hypothetical protein